MSRAAGGALASPLPVDDTNMSFLWRSLLPAALLLLVLGGCAETKNARAPRAEDPAGSTYTLHHDTDLYRVEIKQRDRAGRCDRRNVLFTIHNRLYTRPHVDRVRALDVGCDATRVAGFEQFEVLRTPTQQHRYRSDVWFRTRVEEDLWNAYQLALFRGRPGRA